MDKKYPGRQVLFLDVEVTEEIRATARRLARSYSSVVREAWERAREQVRALRPEAPEEEP